MGRAGFFYCEDGEGRGAMEIDSSPRSLLLMRAARNEGEQGHRPFHYMRPIDGERLSLNVRRKVWENE